MTLRLLVFGQTGQVATELRRRAAAAGAQVTALGRQMADLSDPDACAAAVEAAVDAGRADAVINAAAWTAVDSAEEDEAQAIVVNGDAPAAIARAAARRGVPLVHISTDYVFDGTGTQAWQPDDPTGPLGAYGRTKLAGEHGVRAAMTGGENLPGHIILRTSWVFSAHGANFVKTMLRLSETRDALRVVADQTGGPTPAAGIADAAIAIAAALVRGQPGGTYHYAGTPPVSWCDFATEIFARAGRDVTVTGIPAADYPTPAARPANSRLDCGTLARDFGIDPPDWRAALTDVLAELGALKSPTKAAQ